MQLGTRSAGYTKLCSLGLSPPVPARQGGISLPLLCGVPGKAFLPQAQWNGTHIRAAQPSPCTHSWLDLPGHSMPGTASHGYACEAGCSQQRPCGDSTVYLEATRLFSSFVDRKHLAARFAKEGAALHTKCTGLLTIVSSEDGVLCLPLLPRLTKYWLLGRNFPCVIPDCCSLASRKSVFALRFKAIFTSRLIKTGVGFALVPDGCGRDMTNTSSGS